MNERIKQLAEKADIKESLVVQFKGDTQAYVVQYNELEKFAELIVAECIQFIVNEEERLREYKDTLHERHEQMRNDCEMVIKKCVDLSVRMKQHFGVEE